MFFGERSLSDYNLEIELKNITNIFSRVSEKKWIYLTIILSMLQVKDNEEEKYNYSNLFHF